MAKTFWKNLLLETGEHSGLISLLQKVLRGPGQVAYVLSYHRVENIDDRPWLDPEILNATPRQFEEQMRLLARHYQPITARDLLDAVRGNCRLPKDAVLVTVDDGYRSFQETIFPICCQYGIEPLLFVATAHTGNEPFWWDKVHQIISFTELSFLETPFGNYPVKSKEEKVRSKKDLVCRLKTLPGEETSRWINHAYSDVHLNMTVNQPDTLTWDELRRLHADGVALAPHSHSHPIFAQIPNDAAREEIRRSREIFVQELGECMPIFALPDGKPDTYTPEITRIIHSEGFEIVFTLEGSRAKVDANSMKQILPRLGMWQSMSLPQFHFFLTPIGDQFLKRRSY